MEDMAVHFLESKGYHIVQRNFWTHHGEIDIIAYDCNTLVFVEVKYRTNTRYGYPEEAISYSKQLSIRKAALYYMAANRLSPDNSYRFDVLVILGDKITHYDNAF